MNLFNQFVGKAEIIRLTMAATGVKVYFSLVYEQLLIIKFFEFILKVGTKIFNGKATNGPIKSGY